MGRILAFAMATLAFSQVGLSAQELLPPLGEVPTPIPPPDENGVISFPSNDGLLRTTLDPELQRHLAKFLRDRHSPVAAVVVANAKTGQILALVQGKAGKEFGADTHSALHPGFPAASLFKTVVATAAIEVAQLDAKESLGIYGGCQHVRATGVWMKNKVSGRLNRMNLRKAFGLSCNSFFAKLAINNLGLGTISLFAEKFGWLKGVPTDFKIEKSPYRPPEAMNSSVHTVGRFAAGFGFVGINAVHAAWLMMPIANDGRAVPFQLFAGKEPTLTPNPYDQLFSQKTAHKMLKMMDATVLGGTSSFAFRRGKHRKLRKLVAGKTGTLTGKSPRGLTTWFAGVYPKDDPEIVVSAVVVLKDLWFIKGPHLAAEAIWAFDHIQKQRLKLARKEEAKRVH
jgi:penicillin-binding protein A